jgi:hypothetical protein
VWTYEETKTGFSHNEPELFLDLKDKMLCLDWINFFIFILCHDNMFHCILNFKHYFYLYLFGTMHFYVENKQVDVPDNIDLKWSYIKKQRKDDSIPYLIVTGLCAIPSVTKEFVFLRYYQVRDYLYPKERKEPKMKKR